MVDRYCTRCDDAARWGETGDLAAYERASRLNSERTYRFLIALVRDDQPAATQIEREIGNCPDCLRAFARSLAGGLAGPMRAANGEEKAAAAFQKLLDEVRNSPGPGQ